MTKQPVVVYGNREVRCAYCRTDEFGFPPGDRRLSEGHVSVRFKDNPNFRVYLDRADVTHWVVEAMAGYEGWVIQYVTNEAGKRVVCAVGRDHCLVEKVPGFVRIERVYRAVERPRAS